VNRTHKTISIAIIAVAAQLLASNALLAQGRSGGNSRGAGSSHGSGDRGGRAVVVASPYYSPLYSAPWFYDAWYGDPFGYGYPPAAGSYGPSSSLRLQVEPPQTEVFVDGYDAGPVDQYDGLFRRLRLEPGEHDLELYLQGYKSVRQKIFLQPDNTFRIRHSMQALAPGDPQEPRPVATTPPSADPGFFDPRPPGPPTRGNVERAPRGAPRDTADAGFGAIAVRVQPSDAEVLVDGERWDASGAGERLTIQLPEGAHRVEVRKAGFRAFSGVVPVRRGETATLNVSLTQE